jgi:histone H2B
MVAAKKKRTSNSYGIYIHKVLSSVSPKKETGITISSKAITIIHEFLSDLESRVADKSFTLAQLDKKSTLSSSHVKTAVALTFPPELASHGAIEIVKSMKTYQSAVGA